LTCYLIDIIADNTSFFFNIEKFEIFLLKGRLGLSICYDLRFPEMYTELVQKMGAQILLVPSAFTVPTGHAHWHTLLKGTVLLIDFLVSFLFYES
jgi:predicted amidohydrolase